MHARLDQLLSLRDGAPIDTEARVHIEQCPVCLEEVARLTRARDRLRTLAALDPPRDFWADIQARAAQPQRRGFGTGVAAAAVVLLAVVLGYVAGRDQPVDQGEVAKVVAPAQSDANEELEQLIAQSRQLEALLAHLPERPQVERVSTTATVDTLEQRIQWLDWQLANGTEAGLNRRQAQRLWTERVDLMDSLVKVRYAESAPLVF